MGSGALRRRCTNFKTRLGLKRSCRIAAWRCSASLIGTPSRHTAVNGRAFNSLASQSRSRWRWRLRSAGGT